MPYTKNPIVYPSGFVSVDVAKVNENFSILADAFVNDDPTTGIVKNADTVDGFHASHTPAPNTIVPLNANGILDLSASYVRSNVYTFRRVDLTEATSDYELQVGEEAYYIWNTVSRLTLPLRIRVSGILYQLIVVAPRSSGFINLELFPNNTSYTNAFERYSMYPSSIGYLTGAWLGYSYDDGYYLVTSSGSSNVFVWERAVQHRILYPSIIGGGMLISCLQTMRQNKGEMHYAMIHASSNYPRYIQGTNRWNDIAVDWISLGSLVASAQNGTITVFVRRLA
ncbi:TPA: conserved hypothetical protein [Aquificae Conch Spring virus]|nr:TPA: conserved hypothetical protein [Aquificae Conch Spring virus]